MPFTYLQRKLAEQLGHPSGMMGGVVAGRLNQRNRDAIAGAVAALQCNGGETVADIGFGGGLGLQLLCEAVGDNGRVHGIEPSRSMIARAEKRYGPLLASGRLTLKKASMDALPIGNAELDGWISLNTIYFIPELADSFADLARVLSPTGRGILGVADPEWLGRQPFAEHGFSVRTIDEVVTSLATAGLKAVVRPIGDHEASYNLIVCTRDS